MRKSRLLCVVLAPALMALAPARAQQTLAWPDTLEARVQALALIQTLNADILASRSATLSLEKWCRDYRLAAEPKVIATVVSTRPKPPTDDQRQRLETTSTDGVKYRHVQLRCGVHVLSEAENWYVPGRLTAEIDRLLDTTDLPFGRAVESLEPYRRTFVVRQLWLPLADGWARESSTLPASSGGVLAIPDALFEHHAVLYTRDHRPLAEVHEVYQRAILAFAPRRLR